MLEHFQKYLLRNTHINSKYIPYYLKWISECYAFNDLPIEQKISYDQKKQFLTHLAKTHEDWQVKQADYALRLYHYFLSRINKENLASSSDFDKEWTNLMEETVKALRLRHRSIRTEKTYIGWLRQFKVFVGSKNPQELTGDDVRNFLLLQRAFKDAVQQ